MMTDMETPAAKKRGTRKLPTDQHVPLDEIEDLGLSSQIPTKVRRGARERKVVTFS
jgi:hypothetical protein